MLLAPMSIHDANPATPSQDASTAPAPASSDSPIGPHCPYPAAAAPLPIRLITIEDEPCPYLPGRRMTTRNLYAPKMPPLLYHAFMDRAFRRSGNILYQPACRGCRQCLPIRVPMATFAPNKSQRRSVRRNADLIVAHGQPKFTPEKAELYDRYQRQWHGSEKPEPAARLQDFLYTSPVETIEFSYRDAGGNLLAVGICDVCARSLSSVYFFFDPAHRARSLGVFGAMTELAYARRLGIPYYYLGYWIQGCATMQYKSLYRPCEILGPDGSWRLLNWVSNSSHPHDLS